ncbi:hypothetical protein [Kingella negevensis]|uniref:hypothetical protein n=1 Tax=Kingella negevensis TaxID=1522312 RepID=UPI00050A2D21|nr:hypothetical protein [Kingella negevensis]MDK4688216.1 hypothetical protein [Kingella negevensis]WII91837.1 hypothetical protein QEO93_04450 [Kingella negevensis]
MTVLNTNICILERANVPIFNDMANLLHHALLDSNCHSQISQIRDYLLYSCMVQGAINIILTPHYLLPSNLAHLQPETTIIINSEPLLAFEKSNSPMHLSTLPNGRDWRAMQVIQGMSMTPIIQHLLQDTFQAA